MRRRAADNSTAPGLRYRQVYQYVLDLIADEDLQPGDRLPTAASLAERTGVSLISVRRGLAELEQEGRIIRHQGLGTFIAQNRIVTAPSHTGELLGSLVGNKTPVDVRTELLNLTVGAASKNIAAALSIKPKEPVWEVRRLRHMGAKASILERAVLPLVRVPVLDETYLRAGKSMYEYLRQEYGLIDAATEQAIQVDRASPEEQAALKLPSRHPDVVRIRGISFNTDGIAFDCYEHAYAATDFIFYLAGADHRELLHPDNTGSWLVEPIGTTPTRIR